MPRKEVNAPTERIIKILDDIGSLESYCDVMEAKILELFPEHLEKFPRRPSMEAVISERARQSITLEQTRSRRQYMRKIRNLALDHGSSALTLKDLKEQL